MESEKLTAALYDFIYRDANRFASFSAQLFGGHLTSAEKTQSTRDASGHEARVNAGVASYNATSQGEAQTSQKETIAPHDAGTTDVLASLMQSGRLREDFWHAANGDVILAHGTLFLIDRHFMGLASASLKNELDEINRRPKRERDESHAQGLRLIVALIDKLDFPSSFVLTDAAGRMVAGTLKDEGMEEPITSHYYKHGAFGLTDIWLAGIAERPDGNFMLPSLPFLAGAQQAAQALSDMIFPPDALRVTPIAMFRNL